MTWSLASSTCSKNWSGSYDDSQRRTLCRHRWLETRFGSNLAGRVHVIDDVAWGKIQSIVSDREPKARSAPDFAFTKSFTCIVKPGQGQWDRQTINKTNLVMWTSDLKMELHGPITASLTHLHTVAHSLLGCRTCRTEPSRARPTIWEGSQKPRGAKPFMTVSYCGQRPRPPRRKKVRDVLNALRKRFFLLFPLRLYKSVKFHACLV